MLRYVGNLLCVVVLMLATAAGPARAQAPPDPGSPLTTDFFVGEWSTRNLEFGRDVEIFWTLYRDGTLAYRFIVDGIEGSGDGGTWEFLGTTMEERWRRPNGTEGLGRSTIEKIDEDTIRLIILDNGFDQYRGLQRIYRRRGTPKLSLAP